MTKLTTKEMLIALAEGKKVRSSRWLAGGYIQLVDDRIIGDRSEIVESFGLSRSWEIYEEPVKPVRRYLYDYVVPFVPSRVVMRTVGYFADDKDFKRENKDVVVFKRRDDDWTEL